MFLSKQIPIFAAIMALAPSVLADCSLSLSFTRTQVHMPMFMFHFLGSLI